MRILAVTPYYEPEGGGLERYAHAILRRLAAAGHDVQALAFTRRRLPNAERAGVAVERVAPPLVVGNTPVDPAFPDRVDRALRDWEPDLVVAHAPVPFPAQAAYRAARRRRVPFVATYHAGRLRGSSPTLDAVATLLRPTLERAMLEGAARLIAVGPYVRDHALARHRRRVTLVPPGVDARRFAPNGAPPGPNLLFVGPLDRAYRWKGVDVLWQAFEIVRRRVPAARLTLVGDGDRGPEFARKARAARGAVRVRARISDLALVGEYRRAAVVVLPSTSDAESFGMALAEANACGRPVVASRIGGLPDFVRDGRNGLLARPADPTDLAAKIVRLLEDPELGRRMGRRGRARVLRHHDWDRLARRTERVFEAARSLKRRPA